MRTRSALVFSTSLILAAALLAVASPATAAGGSVLAGIAQFARKLGVTALSAAVTYFILLPFYRRR